ncbi:cytochrome P450 [Jatrophihabitans endophyticus]|uniref:cytochrome P450 n=1 Tax=Jatrophihabitans endophyticus TaxID=1206085 RepID=UPI0019DC53FB|nr:cytochrome P450 [Jatrophihabitans endophyticus]MBE7188528.1 cytochrome P450 [Jatrophihabitans endophyticus]
MGERPYSTVDVSSTAFWSLPWTQREDSFARLRADDPVSWQRPADGGLMPVEDDDGFWAVTRHADIQHVSTHPELFCSGRGVQLENVPEMFLEATQSFLAMDAPRHTLLRKLVSSAFTPKQIRTIDAQIRDQAVRIVDDLLATGDCDFARQVSMRLPMWTIYEMVGLPPEQQQPVAEAADLLVSSNDDVVRGDRDPLEVVNEATQTLIVAGLELAEARRSEPTDDLMTNLVQAEVDGATLTDEEISAFFVLLSVAGNDTTRNTISHTMLALQDFPDQRQLLREDFDTHIATALDEFVRWATPVSTFKRTVVCDTEIAGVPVAAGEKVVMMYPSGNRDAAAFDEPMRFDVTRRPNRHVGFGGGGPHFCLGSQLAKTQLRCLVGELVERAPGLRLGEPDYLVSNFVHGVKSLPCTV